MFAGGRRRSSSVKVMQLFHELKQQFPTIPDHIVTSCVTSYLQSNAQGKPTDIIHLLDAALTENNREQMGRPQSPLESPSLTHNFEPKDIPVQGDAHPTHPSSSFGKVSETANLSQPRIERNRFEMNESASDFNRNIVKASAPTCSETVKNNVSAAKRPNHLDIKSETFNNFESANDEKRKFNIQLSEKCKDVHKLLNATLISEKPPRSPLSAKRSSAKNSPTKLERSSLASPDAQKRLQEDVRSPDPQRRLSQDDKLKREISSPVGVPKKETCSTPCQTTDTLLGSPTPNVNLSLNVNCSVGLVQTPPQPKRTSVAQLTPTQPWLQTPTSPRSYTSVNLTLRPPASTPQDPIDITSQNSSLTYSTSSFDSQKGLQSRLQITVGPGGGSVSSVRARPKSYHPQEPLQEVVPARAGSLNDLVAATSEPPVIIKQQARLERLKIELKTEKVKLVIMKQEIADLEKNRLERERTMDAEVEKQLLMEIKHLRCQCEQLALADKGDEEFYNNIYTGQQGPLTTNVPIMRTRQPNRRRLYYQGPTLLPQPEIEGPKWNCGVCTFLNHPDLDKCEQCEMPRIVHGTKHEAVNHNLSFDTIRMLNSNNFDFRQAARSLSCVAGNGNNASRSISTPLGFVLDQSGNALNLPGHVVTSHSTPNMLEECLRNRNQNLISSNTSNRQLPS